MPLPDLPEKALAQRAQTTAAAAVEEEEEEEVVCVRCANAFSGKAGSGTSRVDRVLRKTEPITTCLAVKDIILDTKSTFCWWPAET